MCMPCIQDIVENIDIWNGIWRDLHPARKPSWLTWSLHNTVWSWAIKACMAPFIANVIIQLLHDTHKWQSKRNSKIKVSITRQAHLFEQIPFPQVKNVPDEMNESLLACMIASAACRWSIYEFTSVGLCGCMNMCQFPCFQVMLPFQLPESTAFDIHVRSTSCTNIKCIHKVYFGNVYMQSCRKKTEAENGSGKRLFWIDTVDTADTVVLPTTFCNETKVAQTHATVDKLGATIILLQISYLSL